MAQFQASTHVEDGMLTLKLDNQIVLQNSDSTSFDIRDHQEYVVQWFVVGRPGSMYSITISSPIEAQFQLSRSLKASGKDYGGFRFNA